MSRRQLRRFSYSGGQFLKAMSALCVTKYKQPWRNAAHKIETKRLMKGTQLVLLPHWIRLHLYVYLYSKIWMIEQEPETPVMYVV